MEYQYGPDGLHWYAYCAGNPVAYLDPSGCFLISSLFAIGVVALAGALAGAASNLGNQLIANGGRWDEVNGWHVLAAGATGALTSTLAYATGGASLTLGGAMASGALISGIGYGTYNMLTGTPTSLSGYATSMSSGAVSGAIGYGYSQWRTLRNSSRSSNTSRNSNTQSKSSSATGEGSNSQWFDEQGNPIWPSNRGFEGKPVTQTLQPGTRVDRYGYDGGTFVSPEGTPYSQRALAPGTENKPYSIYEVIKPVEVQSGKIAPWFGEEGGGIQYEFSVSISELLEQGILKKVG